MIYSIRILISLVILAIFFMLGDAWYLENKSNVLEVQIKALEKQKKTLVKKTQHTPIFLDSTEAIVSRLLKIDPIHIQEIQTLTCDDSLSVSHLHLRISIKGNLVQLKNFFEVSRVFLIHQVEKLTIQRLDLDFNIQIELIVFPLYQLLSLMPSQSSSHHLNDFPFASLKYVGLMGNQAILQTPYGVMEIVTLEQKIGIDKAFIEQITPRALYAKINNENLILKLGE